MPGKISEVLAVDPGYRGCGDRSTPRGRLAPRGTLQDPEKSLKFLDPRLPGKSSPAAAHEMGERPDRFETPGHVQPFTSVTSRVGTWPGTDVGTLEVLRPASRAIPDRPAPCRAPAKDAASGVRRTFVIGWPGSPPWPSGRTTSGCGGTTGRGDEEEPAHGPIDGEGGTLTYRQ